MANYGPAYGTLASNLVRIAYKRDPELDKQAQAWIESVLGEQFPDGSYEDALRNGILLCRLMNKLQPNSIPKYTTKGAGFKMRENLSLFQNAARDYGVPDVDLFQSIDLYEKRNIGQVTHCIFALAKKAQEKNFNGPSLIPKTPEARPLAFTEKQLFARKSLTGLLDESLIRFTDQSQGKAS